MPGKQLGELYLPYNRCMSLKTRPNLITLCGNAQAGPSRRRLVESLSHPTGSPPPAKRRKLSSVSRSVSPNKCLDSDEDVIELVSSDGPDVGNADEVLTELGEFTMEIRLTSR